MGPLLKKFLKPFACKLPVSAGYEANRDVWLSVNKIKNKLSSVHKVTPVLLRPLFDFSIKNTHVLAAVSRVALPQIACEIEFSVLGQKSLSAFTGLLQDIGTPLGSLVKASGEHKIR